MARTRKLNCSDSVLYGTSKLANSALRSSGTLAMWCPYRWRRIHAPSYPVRATPARSYGTYVKVPVSRPSRVTRVT